MASTQISLARYAYSAKVLKILSGVIESTPEERTTFERKAVARSVKSRQAL